MNIPFKKRKQQKRIFAQRFKGLKNASLNFLFYPEAIGLKLKGPSLYFLNYLILYFIYGRECFSMDLWVAFSIQVEFVISLV